MQIGCVSIDSKRANKPCDASQLHKPAEMLGSKLVKANRQNVNQKTLMETHLVMKITASESGRLVSLQVAA